MTADDLSAPLGQGQLKTPLKRRRKFPLSGPQVVTAALAIFVGTFMLWAIIGDNPFGGEPMVAVPIDLHAAMKPKKVDQAAAPDAAPPAGQAAARNEGPANGPAVISVPAGQGIPGNTKTVTIIDGKTGERQEVVIPAAGNGAGAAEGLAPEQKFVEMTSHGPVPKIAADGVRPADAFARPVVPLPNRPDAPRVALIVGGLGISASVTADAIAKLPGPVTLAFMPYSPDVARMVGRARGEGHEILLQAPMEPVGYPENDFRPADAFDLVDAGAESRPAELDDEPVPGLCWCDWRDGRAIYGFRTGILSGPARNRQARSDFCRRRRQPEERRRAGRRR